MDTNTKEIKERKEELLQEDKKQDSDYEQTLIDTIIRMYQKCVSIETISEFTNLSVDEIEKIVDDNKGIIQKMNQEQKEIEKQEDKEVYCMGYIDGRKKGIDEGIESAINVFNKRDVVINMYKDDLSIAEISIYTSVSLKDVEKIIEKVEEK